MVYTVFNHKNQTHKEGCLMENSIYHSRIIYNYLKQLNLCRVYSQTYIQHILSIILSVFAIGFKGKTVNFEQSGSCHRTTIAHFLNQGKWDDSRLESILKQPVIDIIYHEAKITGKPVFCIVDDTISSHTKPSSKALHPIEDAYFHQSHLKGKQDYGHQAVAVMLSCNGLVLNYTLIMYNKSKSEIDIVREIADELPIPPVISCFLCDSWYTTGKLSDAFIKKGFCTIGALKTNRVIFPCGIKQGIHEFALYISKEETSLVTVGSRKFYIYRYEGKLNGIDNAVVLISYPENAFHNPKGLRAFVCTDVSLTTMEILNAYVKRWPVELFFRQSKGKLALDKYQIRSSQGIRRYWLLMSLVHLLCCTKTGKFCSFENGYSCLQKEIQKERILYIYQCGAKHIPLDDILDLVA